VDQIIISGVPPYDGRYPYDVLEDGTGLRGFELSWIKRLAGYLVVDIDDKAFGDHELIQILAVIALCRAGRISEEEVPEVFDRFQHAEFAGMIRLELGDPDREADAGPPPPRPSENGGTSGPDSRPSSETSDETRSTGGTPGSAASPSAPPRSGS
jgi:hypothetical protein